MKHMVSLGKIDAPKNLISFFNFLTIFFDTQAHLGLPFIPSLRPNQREEMWL